MALTPRLAPAPRGAGALIRTDGTWIEAASFARSAGFGRRAWVRLGRSAEYRLVHCGAAEPFGAIAARIRQGNHTIRGSVFLRPDSITFHPTPFRGD